MDGIEATEDHRGPALRGALLILTTFEHDDYIFGACGRRRRVPAQDTDPDELLTRFGWSPPARACSRGLTGR